MLIVWLVEGSPRYASMEAGQRIAYALSFFNAPAHVLKCHVILQIYIGQGSNIILELFQRRD